MKVQCRTILAAGFGASIAFAHVSATNAADVKVLTARAIATVLEKVTPVSSAGWSVKPGRVAPLGWTAPCVVPPAA